MPELPEVETIKRQLDRKIAGKKIERVEIRLKKLVKYSSAKFKKLIEGSCIQSVDRRAKLFLLNLSNGYTLISHLKMSGQLILNGEPGRHTHLIYYFNDGSHLIHNDLRQFGFVKLMPQEEFASYLAKEKFGPEPLSKQFTLKKIQELLSRRKQSKIKPLLMDQRFIAGIGNLYADEILFCAGVQPNRRAGALKPDEIEKVYQSIKRILQLAVDKKGTSAADYLDAEGQKGNFLSLVQVYRKQGSPCPICGQAIKRIKFGNRSAHFCPKCQT